MRAVDQTIQHRVRERGVAQVVVPALARQLAGDHGRAAPILMIEQLEQVVSVDVRDGGEAQSSSTSTSTRASRARSVVYEPSAWASVSSSKSRGAPTSGVPHRPLHCRSDVLAAAFDRFNSHSGAPRPPQTPAASFKRLYRK